MVKRTYFGIILLVACMFSGCRQQPKTEILPVGDNRELSHKIVFVDQLPGDIRAQRAIGNNEIAFYSNHGLTMGGSLTDDGRLIAVDLADNSVIWSKQLNLRGGMYLTENELIVTDSQTIYSFALHSGEINWQIAHQTQGESSNIVFTKNLLLSITGKSYFEEAKYEVVATAFDLESGQMMWDKVIPSGVPHWVANSVPYSQLATAAPIQTDGIIVFIRSVTMEADKKGSFYRLNALDAQNGDLLWSFDYQVKLPPAAATIAGMHNIVITDQYVTINTFFQDTYTLDKTSGTLIWQDPASQGFVSRVGDDQLLTIASSIVQDISLIEIESGAPLWQIGQGRLSAANVGSILDWQNYIGFYVGHYRTPALIFLSKSSGELLYDADLDLPEQCNASTPVWVLADEPHLTLLTLGGCLVKITVFAG